MTDRSAEILEAAINEFIDSGEPVSSTELFRRYSFGIKPAMIRHELLTLTTEGFLAQPYHSAGRIPTDRGYRFFAERAMGGASVDAGAGELKRMLEAGDWKAMLQNFSKTFGLAGVLADNAFRGIHKVGLKYLFEDLEADQNELAQVVEDFEDIGERLPKAADLFGDDFFKVFVGSNPFTKSDCLSVMAADYDVGGEKVFFFAIGPKRMDYEKTAKVLKGLKTKNKKHGRTK